VSTGDGGPCIEGTAQTGGTTYTTNSENTIDGNTWELWTNTAGSGSITVYGVDAQFSAMWNGGSDFLARDGLQWNDPQPYTSYGTITAQFAETKTGTGGLFSYIGIYGWSLPPTCIEFYIVEDSYNKMPVNPGNTTQMGTAMIDGGTYILYTRPTTGTGGSNCPNTTSWTQYYSVRETARTCGVISVTEHFNAWKNAGMTLGPLQQTQLLVETGGGNGTLDFTTATVTATE